MSHPTNNWRNRTSL